MVSVIENGVFVETLRNLREPLEDLVSVFGLYFEDLIIEMLIAIALSQLVL
jgi:hypothetical protein